AGCKWDEIYASLEPYNVAVAGARVPVVPIFSGVGLILGGGYSWITDQYGLGIDNVVSFDLVLPNGTFVTVSDPEILFGLKGGLNKFGIVSGMTMYARPLGAVWGGMITHTPSDEISQVLGDFSLYSTDGKAQIVADYVQTGVGQAAWLLIIMFYDRGFQLAVYQPFLDIPALASNVGVPLTDNRSIIAVILGVERFVGAFDFETPSAYPHSPNRQVTPANPFITFPNLADTKYFHDLLWKMLNAIQAFAVSQGQSRWDDIHFPNLALDDTPKKLLESDPTFLS
ncbi:hypothetical protein K443DRAFT_92171, partial [Laccaria amethystina LaAM-08-1]